MAKKIKISFRQIGANQEIAEKSVNEAFDILFAEVVKRLKLEPIEQISKESAYMANTL